MTKKFDYNEFLNEWNEFNPNLHLSIKDKVPKSATDITPLNCHCDICGSDFENNVKNLKRIIHRNPYRKGCLVCSGKKVIEGINDILTTRPDLEPYIVDKEQAKHITANYSKKILFRCPICGYEKLSKPNNVFYKGFSCDVCSNTISMPNRIARAFFSEVKVDSLDFEYYSDWTCGKRYDVYFELNNQKYVVEMDGRQHYKGHKYWKLTVEKQHEIDMLKDQIAQDNNIKMIRINCCSNKIDDIINNIKNSELSLIFDLDTFNWDTCVSKINTNYIKDVCNYYDECYPVTPREVAEHFKMSCPTIRVYLKIGNKAGLCNYSVEDSHRLGIQHQIKYHLSKCPKIQVSDESGNLIGVFNNQHECKKYLESLYKNITFNDKIIRFCAKYWRKYKGLSFSIYGKTLQEEFECDDKLIKVCQYYNTHSDTFFKDMKDDIKKELGISIVMMGVYLDIGTQLGYCNYSQKEVIRKAGKRGIETQIKNNGYHINVYNNNIFLDSYASSGICVSELNNIFPNRDLKARGLNWCFEHKGQVCSYKGLVFEKVIER